MKDWKAAVRNWEHNGVTHANGRGQNRAQQRQADTLAARDKLLGLSQERHQVNVAVATTNGIPSEKMVGWARWLHETLCA
jgi:hypothetical protein